MEGRGAELRAWVRGWRIELYIYIYLEGQLSSIIGRKSEAKHGRHGGLLDVSFRPLRGQRPIKIDIQSDRVGA